MSMLDSRLFLQGAKIKILLSLTTTFNDLLLWLRLSLIYANCIVASMHAQFFVNMQGLGSMVFLP